MGRFPYRALLILIFCVGESCVGADAFLQKADRKPAPGRPRQGAQPADDTPKAKGQDQARPNPLMQRLIRGFFDPPRPQEPPPGASNPPGEPKGESGRDRIDNRAPENQEASALLARAAVRLKDQDWSTAIQLLQAVLDETEDSLVRRGPGAYVSARAEANRLLGSLPAVWLQRYRAQFGPLARKAFLAALEAGDYVTMADLAMRYLHTESGTRAVRALALRHMDRGEYAMASHWFDVLNQIDAEGSELQLLQAAMAARLSGQPRSDETPASVSVNGATLDVASWLESIKTETPGRLESTDWRMLFGDASRTAVTPDAFPLLLTRWSNEVTHSDRLRAVVQHVVRSLLDTRSGAVPSSVPIVVGERVVVRTLSGVSVYRIEDGALLWASRGGASPEQLLLKSLAKRTTARSPFQSLEASSPRGPEQGIVSLLFRDGVRGLISSDGERVFVIEEHAVAPATPPRNRPNQFDQYRRDWSSNKLVAYDLKTGRIEWEIGGLRLSDTFELPLAGSYFHGVPVSTGGELYLVSERDKEVRVNALQAETGALLWSQLLGHSESDIASDTTRRAWTAQVSQADGILVCPTTLGWLIAVDQLSHSILWAHRYTRPEVGEQSSQQQSFAESSRFPWPPSAPVISGRRVIYCPPEAAVVECLSLATGKRIWRRDRDDLYLAAVARERVVLAGHDKVIALRLQDGRLDWEFPISPSDIAPAGQGVVSRTHLHLPMLGGRIHTLALETGKLVATTGTSSAELIAGNLVASRRGLLMQSPLEISAFAWRSRGTDPDNVESVTSLLRQAESYLVDARPGEAIAVLDQAGGSLTEPENAQRERLLETALVARIRMRPADAAADLDRLAVVSDDKNVYTRLCVLHEVAAGRPEAAFRLLLQLYTDGAREPIRLEENRVTVDADAWLAGQLQDAWEHMDGSARREVEPDVAALSEAAIVPADAGRFVDVLGFHPLAIARALEFGREELAAGNLVGFERWWRAVERFGNARESAEALTAFADALRRTGQLADADGVLADAAFRLQEPARIDPDEFAAQRDDILAQRAALTEDRFRPLDASWRDVQWELRRLADVSSYYGRYADLALHRPDSQLTADFRAEIYSASPQWRLNFLSAETGGLHWSVPLNQSMSTKTVLPTIQGRYCLVIHGNRLSCLAPGQRKVLWQRRLSMTLPNGTPYRRVFAPLQPGRMLERNSLLRQQTIASRNALPITNYNYVCVRNRRAIDVFDAATGRTLWSCDDIGQSDTVLGTTDAVFVIRSDRRRMRVFRAVDGKPLEIGPFDEFPAMVVAAAGRGFILVETRTRLFVTQTSVRLYDPIRAEDLWEREFSSDVAFGLLNDRELLALTKPGEFEVVDLHTGQGRQYRGPDTELAQGDRVSVAADNGQIYVAIREPGAAIQQATLKSAALHGRLLVFDRRTGGLKWERRVENSTLLTEQFRHMPVLFLLHLKDRDEARSQWDAELLMLDRSTGETLEQRDVPGRYYSVRQVSMNPADRWVEVRMNGRRLRFLATSPPEPH